MLFSTKQGSKAASREAPESIKRIWASIEGASWEHYRAVQVRSRWEPEIASYFSVGATLAAVGIWIVKTQYIVFPYIEE